MKASSMTELYSITPMPFPAQEPSEEISPREEALLEEIERLNKTIESIKLQYEELMGVAMQYRDEARKWYEKFICTSRP